MQVSGIGSTVSWVTSGVIAVVIYLVISNTLYLLVGARLLQCLPGVNIRGFTGTLRLATLIILSVVGVVACSVKNIAYTMHLPVQKTSLKTEISKLIQIAAKFFTRDFGT